MLNILYIELFKLKSSKMLWLIVLGAFFPGLISWWGAFYTMSKGHPMPVADVLSNISYMMSLVLAPLLFYLFTAYIVAREYQEKTINHLFTYPAPRWMFYLGKLLTMLVVITATFALSYVAMVVMALVYNGQEVTVELVLQYLLLQVWMIPVHFALIPLAFAVSFVSRSYVAAIILAIVPMLLTSTLLSSSSPYNVLFPWVAPYFVFKTVLDNELVNLVAMSLTLLVTFLIPFLFTWFYLEKADVHSGS